MLRWLKSLVQVGIFLASASPSFSATIGDCYSFGDASALVDASIVLRSAAPEASGVVKYVQREHGRAATAGQGSSLNANLSGSSLVRGLVNASPVSLGSHSSGRTFLEGYGDLKNDGVNCTGPSFSAYGWSRAFYAGEFILSNLGQHTVEILVDFNYDLSFSSSRGGVGTAYAGGSAVFESSLTRIDVGQGIGTTTFSLFLTPGQSTGLSLSTAGYTFAAIPIGGSLLLYLTGLAMLIVRPRRIALIFGQS